MIKGAQPPSETVYNLEIQIALERSKELMTKAVLEGLRLPMKWNWAKSLENLI